MRGDSNSEKGIKLQKYRITTIFRFCIVHIQRMSYSMSVVPFLGEGLLSLCDGAIILPLFSFILLSDRKATISQKCPRKVSFLLFFSWKWSKKWRRGSPKKQGTYSYIFPPKDLGYLGRKIWTKRLLLSHTNAEYYKYTLLSFILIFISRLIADSWACFRNNLI